jgi:tRNA nucleotidyltransferase (CCA-adding enzyme)
VVAAVALAGVLSDTNSLVGPNTRPQDASAVSLLHAAGPQLDVTRKLLQTDSPIGLVLTGDAQHSAFKQLWSSAEMRRTKSGNLVGVAHAVLDVSCPGFANVVSVALSQTDCEALFAIGVFENIVVVVGRASLGSSVNCGHILQALGGGGHAGAAAVTLHEETLATAREKLYASLVQHLDSVVTVAVASLRQMVLLRAPLSVEEARRELVRRNVRQAPLLDGEGQVTGLLDRHLLDRASHLGLGGSDARDVLVEAPSCRYDTPLAAAPALLGRYARIICVYDDRGVLTALAHRSASNFFFFFFFFFFFLLHLYSYQ